MAKVNLKSIYTSADKYTILQLLKEFVDKVDAIDFPSDEEMVDVQTRLGVVEGKVTSLEDDVSSLQTRVNTLQYTTVPNIESDVTLLKNTTVPTLAETVAGQGLRITALEQTAITKIYKHKIKLLTQDGECTTEFISSSNTPINTWALVVSTGALKLFNGLVFVEQGTPYILTGEPHSSYPDSAAAYGFNGTLSFIQDPDVNDTVSALN